MSGLRALTTRARASVTRLLERRRIRFVCISVLVMSLALLAVSFATADRGRTVFGPPLGADYAGFYVAGMLLNRAPPERLYDFALQDEMYHAVLPEEKGHLPFLHPPFVALASRARFAHPQDDSRGRAKRKVLRLVLPSQARVALRSG